MPIVGRPLFFPSLSNMALRAWQHLSLSVIPGVSSGSSSSNLEHGYVVLQDTVKREPLEEVAGDNTYKVNNFLDNKYRPRPGHDIVNLAEKKIGETCNDYFYFPTVAN